MEEKKCSQCKEIKPITDFWKNAKKGKIQSYCKKCGSKYNKGNEAKRLRSKGYAEKRKLKYHSDEAYRKEIRRKRNLYVLNHRELVLLSSAKIRAKRSNLEFNIDISDITIPEYCPLTGLKINITTGRKKGWDSPSLDRIDTTKGYIKGNVAVISDLANTMKNHASLEILRTFGKNIPKYLGDDIVHAGTKVSE